VESEDAFEEVMAPFLEKFEEEEGRSTSGDSTSESDEDEDCLLLFKGYGGEVRDGVSQGRSRYRPDLDPWNDV
jgi:hypothetical protein